MAADPGAVLPRQRNWPRRLLIGINLFLIVCLIVAGSGYLYLHWRFGQIQTVSIGNLLHPDSGGQPMNVLMVGSDSRANLTGALARRAGKSLVTGQRSDTIMVLHIDPHEKHAAILSIPRDLWVTVYAPGKTFRDRINTSFEYGPQPLVQTIEQNLGITINHYLEVDFVGFRNLVSAVGGVAIYVPAPARDFYSDLKIYRAGCVMLTPDQALAWVRSRHYQYYEAGRWHEDPTSDFGRIQRQQDFIRRLMRRSISKGIRNPFKLNSLIGIAIKNITIDNRMSTKDILRLGSRFRSLNPDSVDMLTLPTEGFTTAGGAAVLRFKQPDAQLIINRFNGLLAAPKQEKVPPSIVPNSVRVRVLNGTGVSGQAGKVATTLQQLGFNNAGTGDAPSFHNPQTQIRYGVGQRGKALLLKSYLPGSAKLVQDSTLQSVDLVLTVGSDFSGVVKPPRSGATPTTVASPPTTVASKGAPAAQPQC